MDRDQDRLESFSRRAFLVGAGQGVFLCVLGARLGWLQLVEGEKYKMLAENNRINVRILAPSRGQIVDRYGVPLAVNQQNFQVVVIPEQVDDLEKALQDLKKVITIDDNNVKRVLREAGRNPSFVPVEVRDNLKWEEVSIIEVNLPDLPGVSVQDGELRTYPYKESTAHLVGYVGRVSESEMTNDKLLSLPGFQIGKSGLEKQLEDSLRGTPGKAEIEVNVHGREVRQLGREASKTGERVVLGIDAEFQRFVQQRLAQEKSASAVVMDVHSGSVYAMASQPSFDPNVFTRGISAMDWEQLRDDPAHPLNNKCVGGLYPPGSTFKMVTALAGLKAGVIDENSTAFCPGHYDFGSSRFHCWKAGGHGTVSIFRALAESCDTYFYKMSTALGIDRLAEMAEMLGFGQLLGTGLPEEKAGLMPNTKWKREKRKEPWHPGETIISAIGQGNVQASGLQLATMTSRIVNGGYAVKPWLAGYVGSTPTFSGPWPKLDIEDRHLQMVRQGMERVLLPGGTAYGSRIMEMGLEMGGKTGTAQVKRISKAERASGVRRQEDLPWHLRHHALFVGYAPVADPRYACAVIVDHGGSGSGAAAPIARDIMIEVQKRNPAAKKMEP